MSVPLVSAQTVKQVSVQDFVLQPLPNSSLFKLKVEIHMQEIHPEWESCNVYFCNRGCACLFCFAFEGRSQAHQSHSADSRQRPASAAAHHASRPTAADPAQPHQPAARHCAGPGARNRQRGLRGASSSVRDPGKRRKRSHCVSKGIIWSKMYSPITVSKY